MEVRYLLTSSFLNAVMPIAIARKVVSRIILTRPAIEVGEKLGFLPGDLQRNYGTATLFFLQIPHQQLAGSKFRLLLRAHGRNQCVLPHMW